MSVPVRVQDLEKNFGRYPALKSVSLDVAAGELVGGAARGGCGPRDGVCQEAAAGV